MAKRDPVAGVINEVTDTIKAGADVVTDFIGSALGCDTRKSETTVEIKTPDGRRYEGTVQRKS